VSPTSSPVVVAAEQDLYVETAGSEEHAGVEETAK
jgi:hypothetical protein